MNLQTPMDSNSKILKLPRMSPKVMRILLPIAILGGAIGVAALLIITKPDAKPVEIREKAWPVQVQHAQPASWAPEITLFGRIESQWDSRLTAGAEADVVAVHVLDGSAVRQGDLLVELDSRDADLQLAQREAELAQAESRIVSQRSSLEATQEALPREEQVLKLNKDELARVRDLVRKKVGSQADLDTAEQAVERQEIVVSNRRQSLIQQKAKLAELEAALKRAEALRDQAALRLDRTRISAPFDGRVTEVNVAPGNRVRLGNQLLRLYDTQGLLVRAQIPERYLPDIHRALADNAELKVSAELDGLPVQARLDRLSGQVAEGGSVAGLFDLVPAENLRPGRFIRLILRLPEQSGLLAVPAEALYGPNRLYRVDQESRLVPVTVQRVGESRGPDGRSLVLIRAPGLPADSRLSVTQLANAVEGLLVSVVNGQGG